MRSCVAEHLVAANLAGHDSHGVIRVPQYVDAIDAGNLKPGGTDANRRAAAGRRGRRRAGADLAR